MKVNNVKPIDKSRPTKELLPTDESGIHPYVGPFLVEINYHHERLEAVLTLITVRVVKGHHSLVDRNIYKLY